MTPMLIRASARFRRHYTCAHEAGAPPVRPFPCTWNLDVIGHGRSQLIILASEEYSLYTLLIPMSRGRDLGLFLEPFKQRLLQVFESFRLWEQRHLSEFTTSGRADRRIIGSQNDMVAMTRHCLAGEEKTDSPEMLLRIEEHLNSTPMSYLLMESPLHVFQQQAKRL